MTRRRPALGAGAALLVLALPGPSLASWGVPAGGTAASTAAILGTPSGLTAHATGTGAVTLSWQAPSGPAPDAYVVRRDGRVVGSCVPRTATSCTDSGLGEGSEHTYTVAAALQQWVGSASAPASVRTSPADTTPPTVASITRDDVSPTAASSASWTVAFSEPVTGVDAADFALEPIVPGAAVTDVTGSGTRYTVRASTGTGSGALRLHLVDDDTVRDAALHALGGEGTGNGSATGEAYELDRTAPTVTIDQRAGQHDPADAVPLRWTVVFSEPVTGFDAADLLRTGTTTGGELSVLGSGADYEVSLAGPLSDGTTTLAVRAGAATDGVGTPSTASTSTDSSITHTAPPAPPAPPPAAPPPAVLTPVPLLPLVPPLPPVPPAIPEPAILQSSLTR